MNLKLIPERDVAAGLFVLLCAVLLCTACIGTKIPAEVITTVAPLASANGQASADVPAAKDAVVSKDAGLNLLQIAEIERAGAYFPGLALAESGLREKAGDYAGAAVAAYKELAWAYACGAATKGMVEEGLQNALVLFNDVSLSSEPQRSPGAAALRGCMAFNRGEWDRAEEFLTEICSPDEEPDSFLRWMLLVCAMERDPVKEDKVSAYGAIRARYMRFPEYWYRGARVFSFERRGEGGRNIDAVYAEQCINASPQGPFAAECRSILGGHLGLSPEGKDTRLSSDLRTKAEIEHVIRSSVSMNDPKKLAELFPLMALPDNPYTLYALGAMQALSPVPEFRAFFIEGALKSPGRLGERLNYISRG